MHTSNYQDTIEWLFQQFPSYQKIGAQAFKPDIGNITRLLAFYGNPQNDLKFIHLAGTNGKGSCSSMIASILTESNQKVGLFTSPHILDFTERIRIDGIPIDQESVVKHCNSIRNQIKDISPSFFEITFAIALAHFKQEKCTICVIETGLGGRLDATNIIQPILSIITNIGLEHTNFLGNTIQEIAFEKAGIIKPNTPIVIGESTKETRSVFIDIAIKNNSSIHFAENLNIPVPQNFPLIGDYQIKNFKTVFTSLLHLQELGIDVKKEGISNGLKNINKNSGLKGRMQLMSQNPKIIYDVSHNYDGIKETLKTIYKINKGQLHIVYGTSSDKELNSIFKLFPKESFYYFTEFNSERSASIHDLDEIAKKNELNYKLLENSMEAFQNAQNSAKEEDTILVFGSFFLIAELF
jgi:dihydrofolate synthase / folylpolyglutamate synthase